MAVPDWIGQPGPAFIGRAAVVYCLALSAFAAYLTFAHQPYHWFVPDFTVFWAAGDLVAQGRAVDAYDWKVVTDAQQLDQRLGAGLRPWVYPPPALIPARVLAWVPMWTGFGLWIVLSTIVYAVTVMRCWPKLQPLGVFLCVVAWPVHSALNTGQTSPMIAAAAIGALAVLGRRPIVAGALLAAAVLVKPTFLVLTPIALIAGRHWTAFWAYTIFALAGAVVTTLAFGAEIWGLWIASLRGFTDYVLTLDIIDRAVTPSALAELVGATGDVRLAVQAAGRVAGVVICWFVFRKSRDLSVRLFGFAGGAFLTVPYAMHYDLAVLVPAAAALLMLPKRSLRDLITIPPAMMILFPFPPVAAVFTILVTLWIAAFALLRPGPAAGRPTP